MERSAVAMAKDDVGGTWGTQDGRMGENQYIGKHSPEYRKDGVIGAGRGLEVIRPGMTWGALKPDEKVLKMDMARACCKRR